ncbi:response regulator transcription factor [Sphingobacterium psychroaquaticum]|uniref:Two component transcriptional regulator, LuxR family n=1 Tax=Sphingobacterium psychroaquaticum TaxID=561061 RepID=A0A1X7JMG3_9SPHI|nr:response regulator transcription factor [Sphingobacterium psychroaquaticum]QBQ40816.1 response regulator transcription factor [Sphingobacterium psychroaquaticum]SMG29063.1 two component transcriptional regulator, LuxR family [Sphingobacterium psychroaquaticum]
MIKIILADDHLLVRNGIKMLLDTDENIEVIAELDNGREVVDLLKGGVDCDMIISDISMPEMDGMELADRLRSDYPLIKLVLLSMLNDQAHLLQAFEKGASGYLVKNIDYEELLFAVKHVHKGGRYLCDELSQLLITYLREQPQYGLDNTRALDQIEISDRELEVLHLIGEGFTNQEIADQLFLSKRTVEGHRQNLIDKTGAKNSASLIKYAAMRGLIN